MKAIAVEDMVCNYCALRLCDRCRGRCLCTHNDPIIMAAQALALTMAHFRDSYTDAGYAAVLHHFQGLVDSLPVAIDIPDAAGF